MVVVLDLIAVMNLLPENAVLIAQAITHGWDAEGGQRVHETGGQTSQAAVAKAGVRLCLNYLGPVLARVRTEVLTDEALDTQVDDVVDQ
jgi:hypothetical protein